MSKKKKKEYSLQCHCSGIFSVTMSTSSFCEGTFMLPLPGQNCLPFDPSMPKSDPRLHIWVKLLSLVSSVSVCPRRPLVSPQTPPSETMTVVFRLPFDWCQDITPPCLLLDWSFSVSFSDSFSIAHSSNNNPQRAAYLALFCSMFLSLGILSSSLSQLFLMWTAKEIPLASTSLLSALLLFPAPSYWTCLVSISAWNYPKPNSLPFPLQPATLPVFDRSLIPNISTENPKVIV